MQLSNSNDFIQHIGQLHMQCNLTKDIFLPNVGENLDYQEAMASPLKLFLHSQRLMSVLGYCAQPKLKHVENNRTAAVFPPQAKSGSFRKGHWYPQNNDNIESYVEFWGTAKNVGVKLIFWFVWG